MMGSSFRDQVLAFCKLLRLTSSARWKLLATLTVLLALTVNCAARRDGQGPVPASMLLPGASDAIAPAAGCANALAKGTVCEAANKRALEIMAANRLEAFTVI